ncbi:MAG TPA: hypothetical protein VLA60_16995 [Nitrospirales bacterium]|nr:hypothetical protein [Nitrospirales bacterium]
MARSVILAGIPLLTLPLLAEAGMSRDRSDREESERSSSMEQIVQGEISKKNGDQITLRASNGERITFRINDDTNRLCPQGKTSKMSQGSSGHDSSSSEKTSSSSLFGNASGQVSSQTSSGTQASSSKAGFAFGECNFEKGEFVKAKVDEDGNATFVRSMGQNDDNYFDAGRMGDEYFVLPAGQLGGLDISDKDAHYSVKSSDGQEIGSVYRVMTNSNGDLTYAIVRKADGQLISVPWQALEGSGNKSFKLNVTQNQLGNLPILEEGENAGAHVQRHWDLTEQERQRLAKWNERLDRFYAKRDRYYEDTPTFEGNREGYDRYDSDRSRMSRSGNDRPQHYQDQNAEDFRTRRDSFSPTEFPPHDRAFQYEGADQRSSYNRSNRDRGNYRSQSRSDMRDYDEGEYRTRGNQRSMYSQSRERNYRDPMERLSDRYDTTTSRRQYDPQRQGADQYQSRRSGGKDYDYRPDGYRP